ncbi:hypothetical protein [Shouchella patagoniensis]|uniref:hypothetical protein n=1 Tax=Shouchella patagoniensis TaxID=228576 RepID=UPI000995D20E|nr:hypothetical protein [Shouchella patagoniensis]
MRYFEFTKHEYYALISVDEDQVMVPDMTVDLACEHVAIEVYAQKVAGESAIEVASEAPITQITEEEARKRYLKSSGEIPPEDFFKFEDIVSHGEVILIDGHLV